MMERCRIKPVVHRVPGSWAKPREDKGKARDILPFLLRGTMRSSPLFNSFAVLSGVAIFQDRPFPPRDMTPNVELSRVGFAPAGVSVGWSSLEQSPAEGHIDASEDKFGL